LAKSPGKKSREIKNNQSETLETYKERKRQREREKNRKRDSGRKT